MSAPMWIVMLLLPRLALPLALPPHDAFASAQACSDYVAAMPAAGARAAALGGRIVCVEFKLLGENRI